VSKRDHVSSGHEDLNMFRHVIEPYDESCPGDKGTRTSSPQRLGFFTRRFEDTRKPFREADAKMTYGVSSCRICGKRLIAVGPLLKGAWQGNVRFLWTPKQKSQPPKRNSDGYRSADDCDRNGSS